MAEPPARPEGPPRVVVAMLSCNEEDLLRVNLPKWRGVGDYFLVGIDSKTQDGSEAVVQEVLNGAPYAIFPFEFDGFGPTKTLMLDLAHQHFGDAEFVFSAEPDMYPFSPVFDKMLLADRKSAYSIRRKDKVGHATGARLSDNIVINDGHWRYMFRVHETPVYGGDRPAGTPGDTQFEVHETPGSTLDQLGRRGRLERELELVLADMEDYPAHPRLYYYAGVLHYEIADLVQAEDPEQGRQLGAIALEYLHKRGGDVHPDQLPEEHQNAAVLQQTSAAAFYAAKTHSDLFQNDAGAEKWHKRAIAVEPGFLWPYISLAHLYYRHKRYQEAFRLLLHARRQKYEVRLFMDTKVVHECDVPLMLAKAVYYLYMQEGKDRAYITQHDAWDARHQLVKQAGLMCQFSEKKVHDAEKLGQFFAQTS